MLIEETTRGEKRHSFCPRSVRRPPLSDANNSKLVQRPRNQPRLPIGIGATVVLDQQLLELLFWFDHLHLQVEGNRLVQMIVFSASSDGSCGWTWIGSRVVGNPLEPNKRGEARSVAANGGPLDAGWHFRSGFARGEPVHCRADLSPHDATVRIPPIDLQATGASGRVVIDDNVLTLTNVRGTAGGGELRVGSTMDFRVLGSHTERYVIDGKADIELTIRDGYLVNTRGQGQGTLRMFPFLRPLSVYLEADGRAFRFGLGKG
jgi:hypothetical protein